MTSPFQAGKTYPLSSGGQGEIFVTKDGWHWGREMKNNADIGFPMRWEEETGKSSSDIIRKYDLIAPPTTVTQWIVLRDGKADRYIFDVEDVAISNALNARPTAKAIPIHITTHSDGRIEVKGGSE